MVGLNQKAPREEADRHAQNVSEAEAKPGGLLRKFQDFDNTHTDEIIALMTASSQDMTIKRMWHRHKCKACDEQRKILSAQAAWEPLIQAAVGELQAEKAIREWQEA